MGLRFRSTLALSLSFAAALPFAVGAADPTYTGSRVCHGCHAAETRAWNGSHHDRAMQRASERTVLGDFQGGTFTHSGVVSSFFKRDQHFFVRTDGPDGKLHEYEVEYTFGWYPLQQYLLSLPGGRRQALGIAWDARPEAHGGQRWFHLYPRETLEPGDELHWTGRQQNWNHMCAECHSTGLRKRYDAEADVFRTTWSEIDVACEACHGPASAHVAWAERPKGQRPGGAAMGLVQPLDERRGVSWKLAPERSTAQRSRPPKSDHQVQMCARCHSRRATLSEAYTHGGHLASTHQPSLLREGLYHPDGQIQDEVYVYGSFLQSRMYRAGVVCSDCHDPHSLALRAQGNALCLQCHAAQHFDTTAHHHHRPDGDGADCAACHMPERVYMRVDPRRDHGMRIPRPDLSVSLGVPNVCNDCHAGTTAEWAASTVKQWTGAEPAGSQRFARALAGGRRGAPTAAGSLLELVRAQGQPGIARGTALALLQSYPADTLAPALAAGARDADPLVRLGAAVSLDGLPPAERLRLGAPLLSDPERAIRSAAASRVASAARSGLPREVGAALERALDEYVETQRLNTDRPESRLNLGVLYARLGRTEEAESELRTVAERFPRYAPAYVNLADLYRATGRDRLGEQLLRDGIPKVTRAASLQHALGLLLTRRQAREEALRWLALAAQGEPTSPRFAYVYAVALHDAGDASAALSVLREALDRHPHDRDLLEALVGYTWNAGNAEQARRYAERLRRVDPQSEVAIRLLGTRDPPSP